MNELDSTKRFSNRVENYLKYRPHYPKKLLNFLKEQLQFTPSAILADIGSGTGLLTELFLENGNSVFGVEPNLEMRTAAEKLLQDYSNFNSIAATAEDTTLENQSVDFIVAGQAFHWFNWPLAKKEFFRILKPAGWVLLIWNDRDIESSSLVKEYDQMLHQFGTDYEKVNHRYVDKTVLDSFFGKDGFQIQSFDNFQIFDFEGFKGRLLSSSYAPLEGHPSYEKMLNALKSIFEKYQENQKIKFEYQTKLYYGPLPE